MVTAWSDSKSSESESDEELTADIYLMAKEAQDDEETKYGSLDVVCLKYGNHGTSIADG